MIVALALLLAAGPEPTAVPPATPPATPAEQLREAHSTFDFAKYGQAAALADQLLRSGSLTRTQDQIEANRILGLSCYYLHEPEPARKAFLDLLLLDPDYQLDAFYVPPDAITFFEQVRSTNQELLEPIRLRRRADAQRQAEEARRAPPLPVVHDVEVEPPKHLIVALLPGGAGQFQNGNPQLGYAFAISEGVLVGVIVGFQIAIFSLAGQGGYSDAAAQTARTYQTVQVTAGSIAGVLWILGAAEALWHFKSSSATQVEAPAAKPQARITSRLGVALDTTPGGAAARLSLSF
jgi:hypothetical protein